MKKVLSVLLAVCMLFAAFPLSFVVSAIEEGSPFSGGTGSSANPYIIKSVNELKLVNDYLSSSFALGANIDLSSEDSWTPIGTEENPFTGSFDGCGYIISNVRIIANYDNEDLINNSVNTGFFGYKSGGTIQNLGIEKAEYIVTSDDFTADSQKFSFAGGIVGTLKGSSISNCYFEGRISNSVGKNIFSRVGGIASIVLNSQIVDCYSNSEIYANAYNKNTMAAGIAAWLDEATINRCYSAGSVLGKNTIGYSYVGGISASANTKSFWGVLISYGGTVKNCAVLLDELTANGAENVTHDIGNFSENKNCRVTTSCDVESRSISFYQDLNFDFDSVWMAGEVFPQLRAFKDNRFNADNKNLKRYASPEEYMADVLLLNNYYGVLRNYNGDNILNLTYNHFLDTSNYSFSKAYINAAAENTVFSNSVIAWKTINFAFNPGDIVQEEMDEIGYYELILLNILDREVKESVLADATSEINTFTQGVAGSMLNVIQTDSAIDRDILLAKPLDVYNAEEQHNMIQAAIGECDSLKRYESYLSDIDAIATTVSSILELAEKFASLEKVARVEEEIVVMLDYLQEACPNSNVAMAAAIEEIRIVCKGSFEKAMIELLSAVVEGGTILAREGVNALWSSAITTAGSSLVFGFAIGQMIGKTLSNLLFDTDESIKKFAMIECLGKFEETVVEASKIAASMYYQKSNRENARIFLRSIEMMGSAYCLSCDYARDYAKVVYTGGIIGELSSIFGNGLQDYEDVQATCESLKSHLNQLTNYLLNFELVYLKPLSSDDPVLYQIYCSDAIQDPSLPFMSYVTVACPTDVKVYANNDERIFEIVDNEVLFAKPGIAFSIDNSVKKILLPEGSFSIKIDATDEGKMSYYFSKQTDGTFERQVAYKDLAISEGESFTTELNGKYAAETVLKNGDGESIKADYIYDSTFELLREMIIKADTITFEEYSAESFSVLQNAITESRKALLTKQFTEGPEEQIAMLQAAIDDLEPRYVTDLQVQSLPTFYVGVDSSEEIKANLLFDNGITAAVSDFLIEGYEVDKIGEQTIKLCYDGFETEQAITVLRRSLSDCEYEPIGMQVLDGKEACMPAPRITCSITGDRLVEGIDYRCTYENNTVLGTGKVIIEGLGFFEGSYTQEFLILTQEEYAQKCFVYEAADTNTCLVSVDGAVSGDVILPEVYTELPVTKIGQDAFRDCDQITSIVIPDSVTTISSSAFRDCTALKSIVLPANLNKVGIRVFSGCSSLEKVVIPQGATSIDNYAFGYCTSLRTVVIPDSVTAIKTNAFLGCSSLKSVIVPASVKSISKGIFIDVSDDFVIYGAAGSAMETYAAENGIRFAEYVPGDVNGNQSTEASDLATMAKTFADWECGGDENLMDLNRDGEARANDLVLLAKYLADWEGVSLGAA